MTKKVENPKAVVAEAEKLLAENKLPTFLPGGDADISVSFDGGKTFKGLGRARIGDIRIPPPKEEMP